MRIRARFTVECLLAVDPWITTASQYRVFVIDVELWMRPKLRIPPRSRSRGGEARHIWLGIVGIGSCRSKPTRGPNLCLLQSLHGMLRDTGQWVFAGSCDA